MKKLKKEKNVFQLKDEKLSDIQKGVLDWLNKYMLGYFVTFTPSLLGTGAEGIYGKINYDKLFGSFMHHVELYLFGKHYKQSRHALQFFGFKEFGRTGALTHYHILTLKNKFVTKRTLRRAFRYVAEQKGLRKDCIDVRKIYNQDGCIRYCIKEWKNHNRDNQKYIYTKSDKLGSTAYLIPSNIALNVKFPLPEEQEALLRVRFFKRSDIKRGLILDFKRIALSFKASRVYEQIQQLRKLLQEEFGLRGTVLEKYINCYMESRKRKRKGK